MCRQGLILLDLFPGYRGSPLGGVDQAHVGSTTAFEAKHNIHFQPGVNEDLAATSI